jgi:hypothetical protein
MRAILAVPNAFGKRFPEIDDASRDRGLTTGVARFLADSRCACKDIGKRLPIDGYRALRN